MTEVFPSFGEEASDEGGVVIEALTGYRASISS